MASVVNAIGYKMHGVLNGIDMSSYDPVHDMAIPAHYGPDDMTGKAACKADLQAKWRRELSARGIMIEGEAMVEVDPCSL